MKISRKRIREVADIFKEIHTGNSMGIPIVLNGVRSYELRLNHNKVSDEQNKVFKFEIRPILLNLKKEYKDKKKLSAKQTFFFDRSNDSYGIRNNLNLADYLNIVEESDNCFFYLLKLFKIGYRHFESTGLEWFSFEFIFSSSMVDDYLDNFIDIKDIKYENKYLYSEPKDFQEIENLWKDGMYDKAIGECRNILLYFIDKYQEARSGKRLNVEKRKNSDRIDFSKNESVFEEFLKEVCTKYEIKELKNHLDVIIKQFGKIRNDFKGQPNLSLDDKEIETLYKKINTRMVIDLSKVAHNLLAVLVGERKMKQNDFKNN